MIEEAERNARGLVSSSSLNKGRLLAAMFGCASLLSTAAAHAQSDAEASDPATSSIPIEAPDLAQGAAVQPNAAVQPDAEAPRAVKPPPLAESEFEPQTRWYGWQNLVVEGSVVGMLVLAGATDTPEVAGTGFLTYLVGSPIVHWAHGKGARGFGSLGMRVAAFAALFGGAAMCVNDALSGSSSKGGCAVMVVGILAVPAAIAVDAAVLAYDDIPPERTASSHLLPWVSKQREAVGVSWVGRF